MTAYIALIRKQPGSDYGVDFPDLPGCITAGRSLDEARHMAPEALELHIEGMLEDGTPVPQPSPLEAIMADPANRDAVAVLVDTVIGSGPVSVPLPGDLVAAIDRVTDDRSGFLADAARAKLESMHG
ncbi:MAG TPA: type II toxin-antitoxin system HicB family antitoxin [Acetobacteraceae bacterium]|jgi:predicted RNase H-like HicB family nuclease|nr:type II toxin-antitoxin system HicB family antitoxin [Acetobacteraceae bacterium]